MLFAGQFVDEPRQVCSLNAATRKNRSPTRKHLRQGREEFWHCAHGRALTIIFFCCSEKSAALDPQKAVTQFVHTSWTEREGTSSRRSSQFVSQSRNPTPGIEVPPPLRVGRDRFSVMKIRQYLEPFKSIQR